MACKPLEMDKSTLLYTYSGLINPEIRHSLISDFRDRVKSEILTVDKQKKSAYIFQEAVNNVLNYYTDVHFTDSKQTSVTCSSYTDTKDIELNFTNDIYNHDIPSLEKKINNLNCILPENLKEKLASNLNKPISNDRGANIGLITIILKSNNKLKYGFIKVDALISKFTLTVLLH